MCGYKCLLTAFEAGLQYCSHTSGDSNRASCPFFPQTVVVLCGGEVRGDILGLISERRGLVYKANERPLPQ